MILNRRHSLFLLLIIGFLSCSDRDSIHSEYEVTSSKRLKFSLGEGGLTPDGDFLISLDSTRTRGTIYNRIAHSLDSVFFNPDSAWVKDGELMEREGPYGVGTVFSHFGTLDHTIFLNSQEIFRQENDSKAVSRKLLFEYGVFGDLDYPAFSLVTSAREFAAIDRDSNTAYFIYDYDNQVQVIGYDSQSDSMFELPVKLDSARYFSTRLVLKTKNMTMNGSDTPQLSAYNDKLVVSYPTFNDILVYDLKSGVQESVTSDAESYPISKKLPPNYVQEPGSFDLMDEWMEDWRSQVRFGAITFLKDLNVYLRTVKGEGLKGAPIFLELFDSDFNKLAEISLSDLNPDLSNAYIPTAYGLMFRAKSQPNEEEMYYYYLNLAEKK